MAPRVVHTFVSPEAQGPRDDVIYGPQWNDEHIVEGLEDIGFPEVRLTLTSGVAVTSADVLAATTIFCTPVGGGRVPSYDGAAFIARKVSELSLALDSNSGHTGYHQAGKNYDLFHFVNGAVDVIGSGPTWNTGSGSDVARGTGAGSTELQFLDGIPVNKSAIVLRYGSGTDNIITIDAYKATYLGTFGTTADGQTEDSLAKRFAWSAYNQAPRQMKVTDATVTWVYTTNVTRQANANTANKIEYVVGLGAAAVEADLQVTVQSSTSTVRTPSMGIGLDSTSVAAKSTVVNASNAGFGVGTQKYRGYPGIGRHYLAWLERGANADAQTWYGSPYSEIVGEVWG